MTSKMGTTEAQNQPYDSPVFNNKQVSKNPLRSHKDRPCGGLWENGLCGYIRLKTFSSVGGSLWEGLGV